MEGIRTIFFDFGNVLAFFDHARTVRRLAERERLSEPFLHDILYAFPRMDDLERGHIPTIDYIKQIYAEAGLKADEEFFRVAYGDIFTPNPAVCDLIPKLAVKHRLILASNTNDLHVADFQPRFAETLRHFSKLILSHEIGARKPDLEFYARCQPFAECEPEQCLFIDDRADNIAAAAIHGWKTIQYTDFVALQRGLTHYGIYNDS